MPFIFKLSKASIIVKTPAEAEEKILQIPNPKIKKIGAIPLEQIVQIDTGEALHLNAEEKSHSIVATTGTSTCLQVFLYNSKAKCLIHTNSDFSIDWRAITSNFTDKKINLILIGAMDGAGPKVRRNLNAFFNSLVGFTNENPEVEIALNYQLVLSHNLSVQHGFREGTRFYPKLPNAGFDGEGNVYDVSALKMQLKEFPVALDYRMARKHEAEQRAFLEREFKQGFEPEPILILRSTTSESDVINKTLPHKAVIDFALYLQNTNNIDNYCLWLIKMLYHVNSVKEMNAKPEALKYFKDLRKFFEMILMLNETRAPEYKKMLSVGLGPFTSTVFSYNEDYTLKVAALVKDLALPQVQVPRETKLPAGEVKSLASTPLFTYAISRDKLQVAKSQGAIELKETSKSSKFIKVQLQSSQLKKESNGGIREQLGVERCGFAHIRKDAFEYLSKHPLVTIEKVNTDGKKEMTMLTFPSELKPFVTEVCGNYDAFLGKQKSAGKKILSFFKNNKKYTENLKADIQECTKDKNFAAVELLARRAKQIKRKIG